MVGEVPVDAPAAWADVQDDGGDDDGAAGVPFRTLGSVSCFQCLPRGVQA